MEYIHDEQYWLSFEDGSRILVVASIDKYGAVDLHNHV